MKRGEAVGAGKAAIAVKVSGEGREDGPSLMILMLRGKHSPQGVGGKQGNRGMLANATRLRALSSVAGAGLPARQTHLVHRTGAGSGGELSLVHRNVQS